ncbi:hypothetical protein [Micromonospora carbonacea]|uniref:Uncharacterized protein n=1 Tax=Micromonospora carbonacea TaxID=47853 RepID=A0A1C5A386_9ACTN|nr:hypothetical protein [Micromonospora carbonacea]SCF39687.1 hypothetical protein GA0070563_11152 [Micromonospora carbonacea]
MSLTDNYYDQPVQVVITDRVGGEIARAAMHRYDANKYAESICSGVHVLSLPASLFGGKFDRYIPMDRIGEIQVGRWS